MRGGRSNATAPHVLARPPPRAHPDGADRRQENPATGQDLCDARAERFLRGARRPDRPRGGPTAPPALRCADRPGAGRVTGRGCPAPCGERLPEALLRRRAGGGPRDGRHGGGPPDEGRCKRWARGDEPAPRSPSGGCPAMIGLQDGRAAGRAVPAVSCSPVPGRVEGRASPSPAPCSRQAGGRPAAPPGDGRGGRERGSRPVGRRPVPPRDEQSRPVRGGVSPAGGTGGAGERTSGRGRDGSPTVR